MTINFSYVSGTKNSVIASETTQIDFVNLKNRAEGARRYGYILEIVRYENPEGQVAFLADYQTTLNGSRYQSSKHSAWMATEDEALAAGRKTVAGALKRYAKLAQDPASKIEKIA
jgi:hypothetical protein